MARQVVEPRALAGSVDAIDVRLLRAMGMRAFETWPRAVERFRPAYLAEATGVAPETVKERMARLASEGVLAGFEIYPNARHLGLEQTTFHLRMDPTAKEAAVRDLAAVDGFVGVYDFLGHDLCIDILYHGPQDLDRKLRLVATLTNQDDTVRFYDRVFPDPARALGALDWRIVQALRGNARRPLDEVAAQVGVSVKTVRRRLVAMMREGAVDIVADVRLGRVPNLVVFNLVLYLQDPRNKEVIQRILRAYDDRFFYAWQPPSRRFGSYHVTLFATRNAEIEEMRRAAEDLPGVERAEVMIPHGGTYRGEWLDEAMAERLEELRPATHALPPVG
jgi:DNA-binding Lrp family transcriptional regulator